MANMLLTAARQRIEMAKHARLSDQAPHIGIAVDGILRYLEERHEAGRAPEVVPLQDGYVERIKSLDRANEQLLKRAETAEARLRDLQLDKKTNSASCRGATSDLDLDALQALCDEATSGPWDGEYGDYDCLTAPDGQAVVIMGGYRDAGTHQRNARFIAAARDALPKLIAEVRRLREVACTCDGCTGRRANNA